MIIVRYTLKPAAEGQRFLESGRWFDGSVVVDPVSLTQDQRYKVGSCWSIEVAGERVLATTNVQSGGGGSNDPTRKRGFAAPFAYTVAGNQDSEEAALQAFKAAVNLSITVNGG